MADKKTKTYFLPSSLSAKRLQRTLSAAIQARIPYNLVGDPGNGKSSLISAIAAELDYEVETVIGRHMHPVEAAGLPIVIQTDPENPTTVKALPDWFRRAQKVKRLVLFFDEFGNTSAATQAALLVFIQERKIGHHKLPEETVILMASNPIETGSDEHPLTRPMANRIVHTVNIYNPDPEDWFEGMACNWNQPSPSSRLIEERARICAFLRQNVDLLDKGPANDVEEAGAHPSRRSWDNLSRLLSFTQPDDIEVRDELIAGTVGSDAHLIFSVWDSEFNLPDIQSILDDPKSFDWENEEADRIYAILGIIAGTVQNLDAMQVAEVFLEAGKSENRQDIGAGLILSIIASIVSLGDEVSDKYFNQLTETYMPVLAGAGITNSRS